MVYGSLSIIYTGKIDVSDIDIMQIVLIIVEFDVIFNVIYNGYCQRTIRSDGVQVKCLVI